MSAYSGFEILRITPNDGFTEALNAFDARAAVTLAAAPATEPVPGPAADPLGEWRSLCEGLDWIVKQPQARQPFKDTQCLFCGTQQRIPATALQAPCVKCGLPAFPRPFHCLSCGMIGGASEQADLNSTTCSGCTNTGLTPHSYGQYPMWFGLRCQSCGLIARADVTLDLSNETCPQCSAIAFSPESVFAYNAQCPTCGFVLLPENVNYHSPTCPKCNAPVTLRR